MIELIVNGVPYRDYIDVQVTVAIDSMSNDFTFTSSAVHGFPPFRSGDPVRVFIDDVARINGYIEEVNGEQTEGSHTVTYSGRDRTSDFIDSQVNNLADLRPPIGLKALLDVIVQNIRNDIAVIDSANPEPFNRAEDLITVADGDNCIDIALEYARKRQVLLSSTPSGDMLIANSEPVDSNVLLQSVLGATENNIIAESWSITSSERFNRYIHRGQLDPRASNYWGGSTTESIENQIGEATDNVRPGRQRVVIEQRGYSGGQLKQRAMWARQLARAKATTYSCSVIGHSNYRDEQWQENTLVQIDSTAADITRQMLLNSATFTQGEGQPSVTQLEFVERDVYSIEEQLATQKGTQNGAFQTLG